MPEAIRRNHAEELHVVAAADWADGQVVQSAGRAGVVEGPVKAGDMANVRIKGRYEVASASATTFAAGVTVGWNDGTNLAVAAGTGTFDIGIASKAKIAGELVVSVLLNEQI